MVDRRDVSTWVAIELTKFGEKKVQDGQIIQTIREDLGVGEDLEVFIPAATYRRGSKTVTVHLIEGYIFVSSGLPEVRYFALEKKPYVSKVLSTNSSPHGMRSLGVVPNSEIKNLRKQLRALTIADISKGEKVQVVEGMYKKLDGKILGLDDDHALVNIELRSLSIIARIPRVFLESAIPA